MLQRRARPLFNALRVAPRVRCYTSVKPSIAEAVHIDKNLAAHKAPANLKEEAKHDHQHGQCQHGHNHDHSHCNHHENVALHKDSKSELSKIVDRCADLLPHQGILENFVHHNPLEHFQYMSFKEALDYVHKLETYRSPANRAHAITNINPNERVKEGLVDLSAAFLDRGAAKWIPRYRDKGFLYFFASLENLGYAPWRNEARKIATRILPELDKNPQDSKRIAEEVIRDNLKFFGIPEADYEACIRSHLLSLRGWAGMFRRMETHPAERPPHTRVELLDFAAVQTTLVRASVDDLALQFGWDPRTPIANWLSQAPAMPQEQSSGAVDGNTTTTFHTSAMAYVDQIAEHREELEKNFEQSLLNAVGAKIQKPSSVQQVKELNSNAAESASPAAESKLPEQERPFLQMYTCIDDRECSIRRYVETAKPPGEIETFGLAGFFGIPIRYKPVDGRDEMILAPEGQHPTTILVENITDNSRIEKKWQRTRRAFAYLRLMWERASFSPTGSLALSTLWPLSLAQLMTMSFSPGTLYDVKHWFKEKALPHLHTDFPLPMPVEQAAQMLSRSFYDIGTQERFAKIVLVLGHGAASVNNPFYAAYNCGACGGRDGGPNARLLARLANNTRVRQVLLEQYKLKIPDDTVFVGANHNTTAEIIEFYDVESLPQSHLEHFEKVKEIVNYARGMNALERCKKFLLASHVKTPEEALRHVQIRANDMAEVRPELNHATNAAVVIGRRDLTRGRNLDRRAFLPSYDPFSDNDTGTNLEHVLAPALIVCSGINLEYLFSTIEVDRHGAGTKVPLNVVGNIGVLQGTTGDLRPGLPTQMTEMHTPIRALYLVDAPVQRIEAVLQRRPELKHIVHNEWVRMIVRDPYTNQFYRHSRGTYVPITSGIAQEASNEWGVSFAEHLRHAQEITKKEDMFYYLAVTGMLGAAIFPSVYWITHDPAHMLNPYGLPLVIGGTALALPVLAFARRYLHGEFMFGRFATLTVGLLLGFNMVATASTLAQVLGGWSLLGFSSTFLIGAYNDRSTVRNNATFIFGAYQISDLALLVAATFAALTTGDHVHPELAAAALIVASIYKSSQVPLTSLFARSMEGPTPASALGYAGLSAHAGVVLLTSTMSLWFGFDWARLVLGSIGLTTALSASLVAKIRAERKGAIANASSATIGLIYCILAMGYSDLALILSLGHAAFRMTQVLRAPNVIQDMSELKAALGADAVASRQVPDWLYRAAWRLRRVDIDFTMLWLLHKISKPLTMPRSWKLTKLQQWLVTGAGVTLAGFPFTPLFTSFEHYIMELLPVQPMVASAMILGYFGASMCIIRFLFLNVLSRNRFHNIRQQLEGRKKLAGTSIPEQELHKKE